MQTINFELDDSIYNKVSPYVTGKTFYHGDEELNFSTLEEYLIWRLTALADGIGG